MTYLGELADLIEDTIVLGVGLTRDHRDYEAEVHDATATAHAVAAKVLTDLMRTFPPADESPWPRRVQMWAEDRGIHLESET